MVEAVYIKLVCALARIGTGHYLPQICKVHKIACTALFAFSLLAEKMI